MKTLIIEHPKQQKNLYILLGVIFFLQGIINLSKEGMDFSFWLGIVQLLSTAVFILYATSVLRPNSRYAPRIYLGEDDITLHNGNLFSKPKTVTHHEIKLIQLKPERLTIITKSYDFAHSIDYQGLNQKQLMEEIDQYAQTKNLPVEHITYRHV